MACSKFSMGPIERITDEARVKPSIPAQHTSLFVPGVNGDLGVSLPDVLRVKAADLGDTADL
jgi:hypothetical protein